MSEAYRVLFVEDDMVDQMAFERFVRSAGLSYDYVITNSVAEAKELLARQQFDVALLDYALGNETALDLFEDAKSVPIIVVTVYDEINTAVEVMKAGAFDFIAKDPDGAYLTAIPITIENIIERWQAQQELVAYRKPLETLVEERTAALKAEQARLQSVVTATPTIVFSLDAAGAFTFVVGDTQALLGLSEQAMIGQTITDLFPDFKLPDIHRQSHYLSDVQFNQRWFSISTRQQRDSDQPLILGVMHDISSRKKAEMEAVQERNMLRTLIDNIPDFIFVKDPDTR